jgi:hypothetical protein
VPKSRSPVLGYNHNLRHKGWVFHVQTEDSGILSPHIFTHLFHGGVIVASKKLEYDPDADDEIVRGLMQAQHKSVMKALRGGVYDDKIDAYLGPAPAQPQAIPQDLEEAAATIPTPPPVEPPDIEMPASLSSPYLQVVVNDESQAVVSGTLDLVASLPAEDTDDEINGLLSRLREDTPTPEPSSGVPHPVTESPGAWLVSRPGQKERPFERSGPIPVPVREDVVARRVIAPPHVPEVTARTGVGPAPSSGGRRTPSTGRPSTPLPVVPPRRPPQTLPPVSPGRPQGVTARGHLATPMEPRAPAAPSLPRGPSVGVRPRDGVTAPLRSGLASAPGRSQPTSPVHPRAPTSPPLGTRAPGRQQLTPPAGARIAPSVTVAPRRPGHQDSVVVARPAVVIGAPPTVIGVPSETTGRRSHGRETSPGTPTDSIFGHDLISEKSLDEVIMAYLSEESNDD